MLLLLASSHPLATLALCLSPIFLLSIVVHLGAVLDAPLSPTTEPDLQATERDWPDYTVLIALYREANVVEDLVGAILAIDYPVEDLEVFLLLEQDDEETLAACHALALPRHFHVLVVPPGHPRTKPRALNHGLSFARGTFVTVYDAEDVPDTDQLKKAVLAFEGSDPRTLCFQARLAIDNGRDGWLPSMLQIEYMILFDVVKRGFSAARLPVPLGGTSNHFRRSTLDGLGGWDPFNVTEDAELGIRIARSGGHVGDLASSTYEEAPTTLAAWMRQRRRWLKGYAQTLITHGRQPYRALADLGFAGSLAVVAQLGGVLLSGPAYPVLLAHVVSNLLLGNAASTDGAFALLSTTVALTVMGLGAVTLTLPAILAAEQRSAWPTLAWLVLLPIYLLLISCAVWLALYDLARQPHHWHKTTHGCAIQRIRPVKSRLQSH